MKGLHAIEKGFGIQLRHVKVMGPWSTYKHEELVVNHGDYYHQLTLGDAH